MARRKLPDRVICIEERASGYKRFRLHYVARGRRVVEAYATREEAEEAGRKYTRLTLPLASDKVTDVIDQYQDDMLTRGKWQRDAKALTRKVPRLRLFLADILERPIGTVTPADVTRCCKAWDASPARKAFNTRNDGRVKAKAFFAWAEAKGKVKRSPFIPDEHALLNEHPQVERLRIDECRQLRAVVDPAAARGEASAVFVLACLLLGPRSSELMSATAASLDDGGRVLEYLDAKNKRRLHRVRLPRELAGPLSLLAKAGGHLFPQGRYWAAESVRQWARVAGLRNAERMDTRWLRRTRDTIAVESGMVAEHVARETGHTLHVARKHYIEPGAEASGRASNLAESTAPISVPIVTGARK